MTDNVSVYIETYGCSANLSHSETMEGVLESSGCLIVKNPENSDVIVLNTCIVKDPTEKKMMHRIKKFRKDFPNKKLIVTGCMPLGEYEILRSLDPEASLVGPNDSFQIGKCVKKALDGETVEYLSDKRENTLTKNKKRKNKFVNVVEISQGCMGNCSYCIVNKARGKLKSYPISDVVKDIKLSLKGGCKEIWLTSQDCGCYGFDIDRNVTNLLKEVTNIEAKFRVRLGMSNPNHILSSLRDIIEVYRDKKMYKFLHIPVQSGSDSVLSDMNRHYKTRDFKKIVNEFRKEIPGVTIWTDIIVGFPGETEEDFKETINLLKETRPDFINLSKFGIRPGTPAEKMDQIPSEIIKERSRKITDISEKLSRESNRKWIGKECQVLVTERGRKRNQYTGRNGSYKSVLIETDKDIMGKFVTVKIKSAGRRHLIGELD